MRKLLVAAAVAFALTVTAAGMSLAEAPKTITTEKTQKHRNIFAIPLLVELPQSGTMMRTPTGVYDKNAQITLDASVLYTPADVLLAEFGDGKLKSRGLELKSSSEFIWNGSHAFLLKLFQPLEGGKVKGQWVLVIDREDYTWMVNGAYDARDQRSSANILTILQSAWWDVGQETAAGKARADVFNVSGTPFKLAKVSSGAMIYTKDGKLPTESKDGAVFVASSIANMHVAENKQAEFARENCANAALGNELEIISEKFSATDGKRFSEIIANADDEEKETVIYQTMYFDKGDYNVMVGIAHSDNEKNVEYFKKLVESYNVLKYSR